MSPAHVASLLKPPGSSIGLARKRNGVTRRHTFQETFERENGMSTGMFARTLGHVRQFVCGLHGHDALLHFEQGRMSLQCTSCGYETPGWDLKAATSRATVRDTSRVVQMPLVGERRIA
jgi:hypothetical protein